MRNLVKGTGLRRGRLFPDRANCQRLVRSITIVRVDLNPAQDDAVKTLGGPLLVLAGAGTGKTRVVTYRIAALIRSGVPAERILAVTFTNKAAGEMRDRALALLPKKSEAKPEISTFHSLCVRILRRQITHLGYPSSFAIYDRGDQESLARDALRELRVPQATLRPSDLLFSISRWKSISVSPARAEAEASNDKELLAAMGYRRYQKALRGHGAVDFDDLLLCTEQVFLQTQVARDAESGRFDQILIDEYQDTNGPQYRIVRALAAPHRNLCVVGDDDQSIYGWRGADVTHILAFKKDWPDAKVVRLEENYRSRESILTFANQLIRHNRQRHDKILRAARRGGDTPRMLQYPDEITEAKSVVHEIKQLVANQRAEYRDVALLFRTNEQPRPFETELRIAGLPYTLIGGMSFYDRREVKDLLAYLKLLAFPSDEPSLLRIINTPRRGIGDKVVKTLVSTAIEKGMPLAKAAAAPEILQQLPGESAAAIKRFTALIEEFRGKCRGGNLVSMVNELIERIQFKAHIAQAYPDAAEQQARFNAVEEVVNSLSRYLQRESAGKLPDFLDEIYTSSFEATNNKEAKLAKNAVVLMTLHAAKGLEFPHVYMVGMEEGILPHYRAVEEDGRAIDEERRLCYVGVTRAMDRLTLTLAAGRNKWGKPRPSTPSRFLFELLGQAEQAPVNSKKPAVGFAEQPRSNQTADQARRDQYGNRSRAADKNRGSGRTTGAKRPPGKRPSATGRGKPGRRTPPDSGGASPQGTPPG